MALNVIDKDINPGISSGEMEMNALHRLTTPAQNEPEPSEVIIYQLSPNTKGAMVNFRTTIVIAD